MLARHHAIDKLHAGYAAWATRGEAADAEILDRLTAETAADPAAPRISVLMPTRDPEARHFAAAIASVRAQRYGNWQLCIVDDGSEDRAALAIASEAAAADARIRVRALPQAAGIAAATNAAMELADGSYLTFLDHDDLLAADALLFVARAFLAQPSLRLLYSDEDKIDGTGQRYWPVFKPAWNPDLLLSTNYVTHLVAVEAALARAIGGLREGFDGAQDWDFVLRATESLADREIGHLPRVLYHWRAAPGSTALSASAKPYAAEAQRRVLEDTVLRRNLQADVVPHRDVWHVRRHLATSPLASIVIPVRNRAPLLRDCLDAIASRTGYANREIVVVDNGSDEAALLRMLEALALEPGCRIVRAPGPFNFARLANAGVASARGDVAVLLNNDVAPLEPGWLNELVSHALRPEVGAVGAALFYPDGTWQHAGIVLGVNGTAEHCYRGLPGDWSGINGRNYAVQDFSAVTAACLAVRTAVYREAGGMDEALAVSGNDVDFCLRLRSRGLRIVWTPHARLTHLESASRGYDHAPAQRAARERELALVADRWPAWLADDPAYNPNLARTGRAFALGDWLPADRLAARTAS